MTAFRGYPGEVWYACYSSMNWLNDQLQGGNTPATTAAAAAAAVFTTLRNGIEAVSAQETAAALQAEGALLSNISTLPLVLPGTVTAFMNARIAAVQAASTGISAILPPINPYQIPSTLSKGQPAVAYPGFLEYCMTFTAEDPPAGLTASTLPSYAADEAAAWLTIANQIYAIYGGPLSQTYDTAARQYRVSNFVANGLIANYTSLPFTTNSIVNAPRPLWNNAVALPTILLDAGSLTSAPYSLVLQQSGVIRYTLTLAASQIALFLLALRQPQLNEINIVQVRQNDSLQDIAARATGDFENWTGIATLNGLLPPYPGPTNGALVGENLLVPGSGNPPVAGRPVASYQINVLGTDVDFGPINGAMPTWTGDFQTITGYQNLARALGRRLQTTLGTLVYHTNYGSRIPPEVGAIQDTTEAARVASYGKQALTMDPRTGSVVSATATVEPGFLVTFQGTVQPIGPGSSPVQVNETISPLP